MKKTLMALGAAAALTVSAVAIPLPPMRSAALQRASPPD